MNLQATKKDPPQIQGLTVLNNIQPHLLVIFGASGDLTKRKLIPALYSLHCKKLLPEKFAVLGASRSPLSREEFIQSVRTECQTSLDSPSFTGEEWNSFARRLEYQCLQYEEFASYQELATTIKQLDQRYDLQCNRLFYLATPPSVFPKVVAQLEQSSLISRVAEPWFRLIVEKPFGRDLASAHQLNNILLSTLSESQIYRIDHYLGKETVQNLLSFRFANGIFEPLWNHRYVDCVQITSAETVGMEGRGRYFEEAGILRDMVQNHLFQVLCLFGMEPPASLEADAIRDEKVKLLRCLRPIPEEKMDDHVVRAQYSKGNIGGGSVCGYLEEADVRPDSTTETYIAMCLYADNWRWSKVPFLLRAAKRMPFKFTEINIHFRQVPHWLFSQTSLPPNQLNIHIQPNEGISLQFGCKKPGSQLHISPVKMEFNYGSSFGGNTPEAYERLIQDAMLGDSTLFIRNDENEAAWSFISRIHQAWQQQQCRRLPTYAAGDWGPKEAEQLAARHKINWEKYSRG